MRKLLSFIAILLLATSSLPIGFTDTIPIDSSNIESIEQQITQTRKTISVNLDEKMGLTSDPQRKDQIQKTSFFVADNTLKSIHLDEDLTLRSSTSDKQIHFDYVMVQPQPIVDRILQTDKLRDDRKKSLNLKSLDINENNQQQSEDLILIDSNIIKTTFFADLFNVISDPMSGQFILESLNIFEDQSFVILSDSVYNFDSLFLFDSSFVIVIFTPLVFFLFIFSEDVKFKIEKVHPILSFALVFIILSTVVLTPYSISSSYWPEAYADTYADTDDINYLISDNTTASTNDTSSSSTPAEDTSASEATTSNTDTSVDPASSSSTPAEDSESTEVSSSSNTTSTVIPVNGTVIPVSK